MEIELVEFYPTPKIKKTQRCIGTLHLYVVDYRLDLRGIRVNNKGNNFFFQLPFFNGVDDKGEQINYPFYNFENEEDKKFIMKFLKEKATVYVKDFLIEQMKRKKEKAYSKIR